MNTRIQEGEVILREGEINMDMYKIEKGHAELYKDFGTSRETLLGILSPGAYFGELGLLTEKPAIYTVVAYDDMELLRIPIKDMKNYIEKQPEDALSIMTNMANTMYNLKFDIDLLAKERVVDMDYIAKSLLKYNLNMFKNERYLRTLSSVGRRVDLKS